MTKNKFSTPTLEYDEPGFENRVLGIHAFSMMAVDLGYDVLIETNQARSGIKNIFVLNPSVIEKVLVNPKGPGIGDWRMAAEQGHRTTVMVAHDEGRDVPEDVLIDAGLGSVRWDEIDRFHTEVQKYGSRIVELTQAEWESTSLGQAERCVGILLLMQLMLAKIAGLGRGVGSAMGRIYAFAAKDFGQPGTEKLSPAEDLLRQWQRYAEVLEPERQGASWYKTTEEAGRGLAQWLKRLRVAHEKRDYEAMNDELMVNQPLVDLLWSSPLRWLPGIESMGSAQERAWWPQLGFRDAIS